MEIIAFASGKGGTGKTLMASCLGYAFIKAKQRVLLVDADPATDGLSLFLLGTQGIHQIKDFEDSSTFVGLLRAFRETGTVEILPRRVNRSESNDLGGHGVFYETLISGKGLYGDDSANVGNPVVPDLDQGTFRKAISKLFERIRASDYDYVVIDTRGGFAFESTDVCAMADSFIVVTEADFTSFYQDRNLCKRIGAAADQLGTQAVLRSIIVNKATEGLPADGNINLANLEISFRLQLEKEFGEVAKLANTHPVPVDIEALKAYKTQRIPYLEAPAFPFAFATLSAFRDILQLVTKKWSEEQVREWNVLIEGISKAIGERSAKIVKERDEETRRSSEAVELRRKIDEQMEKIERLKSENEHLQEGHKRDLDRVEGLFSSVAKEQERAPQRHWLRNAIFGLSGFFVAAVICGLLLSYWLPSPAPFKIYIVSGALSRDRGSTSRFTEAGSIRGLRFVRTPVQAQVIVTPLDGSSTAIAADLARRADTLMVIGELTSHSVEESLPIYLGARPQVSVIATVATDDRLLAQCSDGCYDWGFAPLLQLSPTNEAQGRSAVLFASQKHKRRFLVVSGSDPILGSYDQDIVRSFSNAIMEAHAVLVGVNKTDALPSELDFDALRPDCVLYAGGIGEVSVLLNRLSRIRARPMVILTDAVLGFGSSETFKALQGYDPVYVMSATSVVDPDQNNDAALQDALSIAAQLIKDVNERGTDFRFRLKSLLSLSSVDDARRNLVRVMQEDSVSRAVFYGALEDGRPTYIFSGNKRENGVYHVLEWTGATVSGSWEFVDVDAWHAPSKQNPAKPLLPASN